MLRVLTLSLGLLNKFLSETCTLYVLHFIYPHLIEFYVCTSSRQQSLEYQSGTTKNLQLSHSVRGASENIFKFLSCLSQRKVTFIIKQNGSIMNILTLRIIATRFVAISTNKPSGLLEA